MYTDIATILKDAAKNHYAVLASVAINMEMVRGMIAAANEKRAPLIILLGQNSSLKHATCELLIPMNKAMADKTPCPIAAMLDHGKGYERITYAFRHGFSSIMIDASECTLEENIVKTKQVVKLCHMHGMAVEAEIGHVGFAGTGDYAKCDWYTAPEEAERFVKQTNVDCLAVAVGTAHGEYPLGYTPQINFDRIYEIKKLVGDFPLALHGGSGSTDGDIRKAVKAGINKINVATDILNKARDFLRIEVGENPKKDFISLMSEMENVVKNCTMNWIELTGSKGKAVNFYPQDTLYTILKQSDVGMGE